MSSASRSSLRLRLVGLHRPALWRVSSHEEAAATQPRQISVPGCWSSAVTQWMCIVQPSWRNRCRWFSNSHLKQEHCRLIGRRLILYWFSRNEIEQTANYRPVSLTSVLCKIMESIIKERLTKFLDSHQLLCKEQHGLSRGRSCVTNLLETLENQTKALDEGFGLDIVYLDYKRGLQKWYKEWGILSTQRDWGN